MELEIKKRYIGVEDMLANCVIYTLEVVKYYLIMKNFLGFKIRKNWILSVVGAIVIIAFSGYITTTKDNPLLMFWIYIFIEMFILVREKYITIVLSTFWLMFIVGMLDGMFIVVTEFVTYKMGLSDLIIESIAVCFTTMFLMLLVWVIKQRVKNSVVNISKTYYIYFTILAVAEGILTYVLERSFFNETGVKALVLIFICTVVMLINLIIVMALAVSNDGYKERDELNKKYLKIQSENYLYIKKKNEDTRKFRHDINNHIITIKQLLMQKKLDELEAYLKSIEDNIHINDNRVTVNNGVVDAVLNQTLYDAEKNNVDIDIEGELYEECFIEPYDLCVIFANLMKNAIEAAKESNDKKIQIKIVREKEGIEIRANNSYKGQREKMDGKYVSSKKDKVNHGYGLKNIEDSLMKYKGRMEIKEEEKRFHINIFIPWQK